MPPLASCRSPRCHPQSPIAEVFFRRSRLFFREAAFFSGGEGCEWRAQRATVGASGKKLKTSFQALFHSPSHDWAPALTSPPPDFLFSSIHPKPTIPPQKSNIPYWYCPLCTPSLTLPPSSLKCLQKSNPNIHSKCFRCFKCFGCFRCFISLLDHKIARFWSKSEQTRQIARITPAPYHGYGKHPKRQSTYLWGGASPTCLRRHTQSYPASYSRSCFLVKAALFSLHATKAGKHRRF